MPVKRRTRRRRRKLVPRKVWYGYRIFKKGSKKLVSDSVDYALFPTKKAAESGAKYGQHMRPGTYSKTYKLKD
jgi:hypothetical protein